MFVPLAVMPIRMVGTENQNGEVCDREGSGENDLESGLHDGDVRKREGREEERSAAAFVLMGRSPL